MAGPAKSYNRLWIDALSTQVWTGKGFVPITKSLGVLFWKEREIERIDWHMVKMLP